MAPPTRTETGAEFYEAVFGWDVGGKDTSRPSFSDGTGHVAGAWVTNQQVSATPGVLPYIYVDDVDAAVGRIKAKGGKIVVVPYPEGNLTVATFRDPAGNVMGLWQET